MTISMRHFLYISLLCAPLLVQAGTKVAGIELADRYQVGDQSLLLNGAGIRSKLFFKIYIGALYVGKTSHHAAELLATPGPKSMQMQMLYKEVDAEKITAGWSDGFAANLSEPEFKAVEERLRQFNALFPALKEGDIVRMDYLPGTGTRLSINGQALGNIDGQDFFTALLKVWIGNHPADADLKKGLLGH